MLYSKEGVNCAVSPEVEDMRYCINSKEQKGQTAVEYMLLLAAVVAIVLVGFRNYLPRFHSTSNTYFNQVGIGILGMENRCGDGVCRGTPSPNCCVGPYCGPYGTSFPGLHYEDCEKCPVDCCYCDY